MGMPKVTNTHIACSCDPHMLKKKGSSKWALLKHVTRTNSIGTRSFDFYILPFWNFRHRLVRLYVIIYIYIKSFLRFLLPPQNPWNTPKFHKFSPKRFKQLFYQISPVNHQLLASHFFSSLKKQVIFFCKKWGLRLFVFQNENVQEMSDHERIQLPERTSLVFFGYKVGLHQLWVEIITTMNGLKNG